MKLLTPWMHPLLGRLKDRVVMAPMTRTFAKEHLATPDMQAYYARRAKDGIALIITEGIVIHHSGDGYKNTPHMETTEQAESWTSVVDAVHKEKTKIFCQLWHCGRISHEEFTGGTPPVSSSAKQAEGISRQNNKPYAVPRALRQDEIPDIIEMYLDAGRKALSVGFDGVELHMGHGYLIDSFFDARVNDRKDEYGGSVDNRCRFALELVSAALKEFGEKRVMVRISPSREMNGLYEWPDMDKMIAYLMPAFDEAGLRLLDVSCARSKYTLTAKNVVRHVRQLWPHFLMSGASLTKEEAEEELVLLDMIVWGELILANPDFVTRMREGLPLLSFQREMLGTLY
jgi:2,4-dienoyl-CoA reductase-like NADH-dependent reductase (Old Yellow Enzyme family)